MASVTSLVPRGAPPGAVRSASDLAAPEQAVGQRVLPVREELASLLPHGGLRRGSTGVVRGSTSLLFTLLATATERGSWAAVVGMPGLGLLAAADLGIAVRRLAVVPEPGAELASVVAALLDGVDMVAVSGAEPALAGPSGAGLARRLSARARHRGAVLIPFESFGARPFGDWPNADLELSRTGTRWSGLGGELGESGEGPNTGHGHLAGFELAVSVRGRGAAVRPRHGVLVLPGGPGQPGEPGEPRPEPDEEREPDRGVRVG